MDIQGDDNKITILTTRRKFKKFITVVTGLSKYGIFFNTLIQEILK